MKPFDKNFSEELARPFVEAFVGKEEFRARVLDYFESDPHDQPVHVRGFWLNLLRSTPEEIAATILSGTEDGRFARETLPPLLRFSNEERAAMVSRARSRSC